MNELNDNEMIAAVGGSAESVQNWGAQLASTSLGYATSANPLMWVAAVIGANIGAGAYYGGWAWHVATAFFN